MKKRSRLIIQTDLLARAVEYGNRGIVEKVIETGVDPNSADRFGITALHIAAHSGDLPMVQLLIDRGADPNATTIRGQTPLQWAAEQGHLAVSDLLSQSS